MSATPRPARYESLDLWRGVACLLVVLLHAAHYAKARTDPAAAASHPVGYRLLDATGRLGVGVQLFFVISGYCIAATADAARRRPAGGGAFLVRRVRRILPPYWAALAVTAAAVALEPALGLSGAVTAGHADEGPLIPPVAGLTASQWVGNLTLTEHWRWHLGGDPESKLHGPSWTLCYEEQFYATCGLFLLVAPRRFFAAVAGTAGVTLALVLVAHGTGRRVPTGFFFDGNWLVFAAGVAVYRHRLTAPGRRWVVPSLLAAAVAAGLWFRYAHLAGSADRAMKQRAFEWVVGAGFGLALIGLAPWDQQLAGLRVTRPVLLCGRMCYSLYLIHWPAGLLVAVWLYHGGVRGVWPTLLVTVPAATAASVAAAAGFYWLVERHFLNPAGAVPRPVPASRADLARADVVLAS